MNARRFFRFRYSLSGLLLVVAVCAVGAAVVHWWQVSLTHLTFETPTRFEETTEPQVAVFYLSLHYPSRNSVVSDAARQQVSVDELRVFVEEEDFKALGQQWDMPSPRPRKILVRARIHLERGRCHVAFSRGFDPQLKQLKVDRLYRDCYFARLDKVYAVIWRDKE